MGYNPTGVISAQLTRINNLGIFMKSIVKKYLILSISMLFSTTGLADYPLAILKNGTDTTVVSAKTYEDNSFAATHLIGITKNGENVFLDPLAPAKFGAPEIEIMHGYCAVISDNSLFTGTKTRYFGEGKYNLKRDYGYTDGIKALALYWSGRNTKCQTLKDIPIIFNAEKTQLFPLIDTSQQRLYFTKVTNPTGFGNAISETYFATESTKRYVRLNDFFYVKNGALFYDVHSNRGGFIDSAFLLSVPKCYEVEITDTNTYISKVYRAGMHNLKSDFKQVHVADAKTISNCIPERTTGLIASEYDDLPTFSADYYLAANDDISNAYGRQNFKAARLHWDTHGKKEGRISSPSFNVKEYLQLNPDLVSAFGNSYVNVIEHFKNYGIKEGRQSSLSFNVRQYLSHYPDLQNAFGTTGFLKAHNHWIHSGLNEGRRSSATFYVASYLTKYSDLATAFGNRDYVRALVHYHQFGISEGRTAN
ncbi:hypothetical protein D0B88_18920 [Cellvibrio sp. KY-YJ-3]|nr:hypothetical protein D0B88_18920 [Cellvibrio sp. KY-YJ-3]